MSLLYVCQKVYVSQVLQCSTSGSQSDRGNSRGGEGGGAGGTNHPDQPVEQGHRGPHIGVGEGGGG